MKNEEGAPGKALQQEMVPASYHIAKMLATPGLIPALGAERWTLLTVLYGLANETLTVAVSQSVIATQVGVRRETVSRRLRDLVVELSGKGRVTALRLGLPAENTKGVSA